MTETDSSPAAERHRSRPAPLARFSPMAVRGFEFVFRPWMRTRLHDLRVAGVPRELPAARPLLLAANHVSWWDAFVLREVQRRLRPAAPMYTLMSAREMSRFPFFRVLGVIGIDGDSPASVAHGMRLLERRTAERPDSAIVLFPQGRIWPSHSRPLRFQRGIELFARHIDPIVLPVGLHMEPMTSLSPTFFASIGEPTVAGDVAEVQRRVEAELDSILHLLARHGEDSLRSWPVPWQRLPAAPDNAPWK